MPAYTFDIAQNDLAIPGSIAGLAAPVTGTVSSAEIGNFLADNPDHEPGNHLRFFYGQHLRRYAAHITATLPLDWTNLVAESLNGLFTGV